MSKFDLKTLLIQVEQLKNENAVLRECVGKLMESNQFYGNVNYHIYPKNSETKRTTIEVDFGDVANETKKEIEVILENAGIKVE